MGILAKWKRSPTGMAGIFCSKNTPDHWMIRVDANTNQVIDENNLTVYCNWDEHHNHNADGITETKVFLQAPNPLTPLLSALY